MNGSPSVKVALFIRNGGSESPCRWFYITGIYTQMINYPEDYLWSSYRTMIGITDDGITERKKTLAYFSKNSVFHYREFVEDIGHKYIVEEQHIRKMIGEDELWLPW